MKLKKFISNHNKLHGRMIKGEREEARGEIREKGHSNGNLMMVEFQN